jgi:hypothetical protein
MLYKNLIWLLIIISFAINCASGGEEGENLQSESAGGNSGASEPGFYFEDPDEEPPPLISEVDDLCFVEKIESTLANYDIIILLDRSGSMDSPYRWQVVINSLNIFFENKQSEGLNIGLNFFPPEPIYDENLIIKYEKDQCDPNSYSPTHVPLDSLPQHVSTLKDALLNASPEGDATPLYGALQGTYLASKTLKSASTNDSIVILATDGMPSACNTSYLEITKLADDAYKNDNIKTYVIGLSGSDFSLLNGIAFVGGTENAFDISSNSTLFLDKMKEIRNSFKCQYKVLDDNLDLASGIVEYHSSIGFPDWSIPQVEKKSDCHNTMGWYYDISSKPYAIVLCDQVCDLVTSDPNPEIYIGFQCLESDNLK